jgi:hypothetical protein
MRDVLRKSLGRSLAGLRDVDRLAAAWPVACGVALAERGTVVGYEDGVVQVEVVSRMWMLQMIAMRGALEREMGRVSGVRVSGIHFKCSG